MTVYSYTTSADGYCEYATKRAAVRAAERAGALLVQTGTGRVVWRNPRGGEVRGEVCDRLGQPLPLILQPPLD